VLEAVGMCAGCVFFNQWMSNARRVVKKRNSAPTFLVTVDCTNSYNPPWL
jgi:uncharacterized protein (DUF2164 family)